MKIKNIIEARQDHPEVEYEIAHKRKTVESEIDKINVILSGHKSGSVTRLARTFNRIKFISKQQAKLKDQMTKELKGVSDAFFDEEDKIYTRVIKTVQFILTLSKETTHAASTMSNVNFEAVLADLSVAMPELEDTLAELMEKHTEILAIAEKKTQQRLTSVKPVKPKLEESIKLNAFKEKLSLFVDHALEKFDKQFSEIESKIY